MPATIITRIGIHFNYDSVNDVVTITSNGDEAYGIVTETLTCGGVYQNTHLYFGAYRKVNGDFPNVVSMGHWYVTGGYQHFGPVSYSCTGAFYNANIMGCKLGFRSYNYAQATPNTKSLWVLDSGDYDYITNNYCSRIVDTDCYMNSIYSTAPNIVPAQPATPTFTVTQSCVSNNLNNRIQLTSVNWTSVDYISIQKDSGSGYAEVIKIYSGDTEYYDDTTGIDGYYKVIAHNSAYNETSTIQAITFAPVITAKVIYADYPTLTFTAKTTNFCTNITNVKWYLDGTLTGTTTGNTFTSVLPNQVDIFDLTAKYTIGTGLTSTSNIEQLIFFRTGSTSSGFTTNSTINISGYNRIKWLLVGGGGAGGGGGIYKAAGGGGGGILTGTTINPTGSTLSVIIGSGGTATSLNGNNGGNTTFYGHIAYGGGGGAQQGKGANGGSGGGSGFYGSTITGGAGTSGQGNNGGGYIAGGSGYIVGGGGGGAGGAGGNASGIAGTDGAGGAGKNINFTGNSYTFSKGGNGGNSGGNGVNYGDGGNAKSGNGKSGFAYIELYSYYPAIPIAPSGLTASLIDCDSLKLTWKNNDTSEIDGNYVQQLSGGTWVTIASVASGTTNYTVTGLTPNTNYQFRVVVYNYLFETESSSIITTTLNASPYNVIATLTPYLKVDVDWSINDSDYGTSIIPMYRLSGNTTWISGSTLSASATTYQFTGLNFNSTYEIQILRTSIDGNYVSAIITYNSEVFFAPTGLTVSTIQPKQICLTWINNYGVGDNTDVFYQKENQGWNLYANVSANTTSICVTGLSMIVNYSFYVVNNYGIYSLSSTTVNATTIGTFVQPFCTGTHYSVTGSTCGNNDGMIAVEEDYTNFYNFTLTDIFGNVYTLTDYWFSGLSASWYQITATPKSDYYYHYGNASCTLDWIALEDTNTSITLVDTKIKNAVCGGFGGSKGRIIYQFTDSGSTTGITFNLWNIEGTHVNQQILTGSTFSGLTNIQYNAPADSYYGVIENSNGCTYLIDLTFVDAERLYTVTGIQRLFITPWSASTSYNYFDSTSEDWYVAGIDTQSFTSTKMKEYIDLADFWYEIKLNTAAMSYSEVLQKDQNGLTYAETVTITIPKAENSKWKQLSNILTQRYIVVFQDNHDQWWTCFYRYGAEVKSYSLSENQYVISLVHPSVNKMLTAIDYNYVKLNIL